jgi:hypothetical protein
MRRQAPRRRLAELGPRSQSGAGRHAEWTVRLRGAPATSGAKCSAILALRLRATGPGDGPPSRAGSVGGNLIKADVG